jgi:hypothetical protein
MDYLDQLKRAYKANSGSGICAMSTQLVCEHPSYQTDLKAAGLEKLIPVMQTCYLLNSTLWAQSRKKQTPLQRARKLVEILSNSKIWPNPPEKRFEFMSYGVSHILNLQMKQFYSDQARLKDNARFGSTTISVLKKLRDLMLLNPITSNQAAELTQYMLITKLTR